MFFFFYLLPPPPPPQYIIAGGLAVGAASHPKKALVVASLVMNIFACLFTLSQMGVGITVVIFDTRFVCTADTTSSRASDPTSVSQAQTHNRVCCPVMVLLCLLATCFFVFNTNGPKYI